MAASDTSSSISSAASTWINAFKGLSDSATSIASALEDLGWLFHKEPARLPKRLMYLVAHIKYKMPKPNKGITFTQQFKGNRYPIGNKTC